MDAKWTRSYDLVLFYQQFQLLLIAILASLACMGALASLLFAWRECFVGSSRPVPAPAATGRASSQNEISIRIRLIPCRFGSDGT